MGTEKNVTRWIFYCLWTVFLAAYFCRSSLLGGHFLSNISSYAGLACLLLTVYELFKGRLLLKGRRINILDVVFLLYIFLFFNKHEIGYFAVLFVVYIVVRLNLFYRSCKVWLILLFLSAAAPIVVSGVLGKLSPVGNIQGIFSTKNTFGYFVMITTSVPVFLLVVEMSERRLAKVVLYGLLFLVGFVLTVVSGCRAALLSETVLIVLLLFISLLNYKLRWKVFVLVCATLLTLFALGLTNNVVKYKLKSFLNFRKDSSANSRLIIARACFALSKKRLWSGWGTGKVEKYLVKYRKGMLEEYLPRGLWHSFEKGGCHNTMLSMGVQRGIWGYLCFFMFALVMAVLFFKSALHVLKDDKDEDGWFFLAVSCIVIALWVNSHFEVMLFSKRGVLFFYVFALCANAWEKLNESG
ncbi:hypothetical protein TST_0321 [Thermosulfidibacter takaii ABI70S6]|uniref:O-antigen ligase-related domain-containing protein n=1 Tax=Thermosulfidibacter takaii (strain DSM 17441 / JCM 13301 / NBRC 103674 / ABI70S6) TaxID=1298851 RepID=A0A0S3QS40_THET7|nr:O-antigen ligase family protein [Thermosulfidibacter takaii]BAT71129.1 hypothetical protein TST_0321 [Thermosulfidibacter takaii ABI70S6]